MGFWPFFRARKTRKTRSCCAIACLRAHCFSIVFAVLLPILRSLFLLCFYRAFFMDSENSEILIFSPRMGLRLRCERTRAGLLIARSAKTVLSSWCHKTRPPLYSFSSGFPAPFFAQTLGKMRFWPKNEGQVWALSASRSEKFLKKNNCLALRSTERQVTEIFPPPPLTASTSCGLSALSRVRACQDSFLACQCLSQGPSFLAMFNRAFSYGLKKLFRLHIGLPYLVLWL